MPAAPQVMYATGPLITADGEFVNQPRPLAAIIVRCVSWDGFDLADPIVLKTDAAREALTEIIGRRTAGEIDAERFARRAFRASCDWQDARGRGRLIARHIYRLDALATAAVKNDIPATVTWTEGA